MAIFSDSGYENIRDEYLKVALSPLSNCCYVESLGNLFNVYTISCLLNVLSDIQLANVIPLVAKGTNPLLCCASSPIASTRVDEPTPHSVR